MILTKRDLAQLAELRLAQWRQHGPLAGAPRLRRLFLRDFTRLLVRPAPDRVTEVLATDGRLRAALSIGRETLPHIGRPAPLCRLWRVADDDAARRWLAAKLRAHADLLGKGTTVNLAPEDAKLLPTFARLGIHPEALVLAGDPRRALRGLRRVYGDLGGAELPDGLRIAPVTTAAHVRESLRIIETEFRRNPRFGWFVASPHFLGILRQKLEGARKERRPSEFVVLDGRRVVGHFGFHFKKTGWLGRPTADLGLNFSAELQGRGFAKHAYHHLLTQAAARGARIFVGSTGQTPVLRLSQVMERRIIAYSLRAGEPLFPPGHFRC